MKLSNIFFKASFVCFVAVVACSKNESATPSVAGTLDLPSQPYNYSKIQYPAHFSVGLQGGGGSLLASDNTPANNPVTDQGATLGRVLFYDKSLSKNGTVACASCHVQQNGFSDPAKLSKGFEGGLTRRHSMGLINARFYQRGRFFWDERATTLEQQVLMPFQDATEMGMTLQQVVDKVKSQSYYNQLFINSFGSNEVTSDKIARALAQFVRSIVSVNSKYDTGRAIVPNPNIDFPNFSASENNGKRLFFLPPQAGGLGCVGCHATEGFINHDRGATNNGLDAASTTDRGVFEAIPQPMFLGAFKVPSLKNIAVTAPYMHDGRFATLAEVVEHYNSGIKNHPNLFPTLKDQAGNPLRFNLSATQKADLVAFMNTLTDNEIMNDVKFSNPFGK